MVVRREALNWFKEAKVDLSRAEKAFREGDYALSTFMSQQACEKSFKAAYLGVARRDYPRTHDLVVLYNGLKKLIRLGREVEEMLPEVSQYYTAARYPNAGLELPSESISRLQAERALRVAREVVRVVEEALEREDP
ncbi:MAG: HEPN domain-containing protein [Desulfurococcales archaeon]|nr:HEPN domain-containing protein [Desulfurococcales archaeon]